MRGGLRGAHHGADVVLAEDPLHRDRVGPTSSSHCSMPASIADQPGAELVVGAGADHSDGHQAQRRAGPPLDGAEAAPGQPWIDAHHPHPGTASPRPPNTCSARDSTACAAPLSALGKRRVRSGRACTAGRRRRRRAPRRALVARHEARCGAAWRSGLPAYSAEKALTLSTGPAAGRRLRGGRDARPSANSSRHAAGVARPPADRSPGRPRSTVTPAGIAPAAHGRGHVEHAEHPRIRGRSRSLVRSRSSHSTGSSGATMAVTRSAIEEDAADQRPQRPGGLRGARDEVVRPPCRSRPSGRRGSRPRPGRGSRPRRRARAARCPRPRTSARWRGSRRAPGAARRPPRRRRPGPSCAA